MLNVSNIHKSLVFAILILVSLCANAQENILEVTSFSLEENSLTAKNAPVRDSNNQKCALVIISGFGDEHLRFNVGNTFSKVEEKKDDQGEPVYLLWIPEGTVKVTISSDSKNFTAVDYFFNPRVKRAETYIMNLKLSMAKTLASKQYLEFNIEPVNAYLEVNDELWEVRNGIAYKQVPKGLYQYRILATDYHTEVGSVDFSDLSKKKTVQITLKPNFGWLTIIPPNGLSDLIVFIDNEISTGLNRIKLSSGQHTLRVACEKYLPYNQTINISDEQELTITPELTANFSTVNIETQGGTSIYIDDKLVGTDYWSGSLSVGSYSIEIRKDYHKTKSETISIPKIGEIYSFRYTELTPILGSISVETNPPGAVIKIDGKDVGKAPIFIPELIIGNHSINATLKNHKSFSGTFSVEEGKQIDLSYTLETGTDAPIPPTPSVRPVQNKTGKKKYAVMDSEKICQSMPEYATLQQQLAQRQNQAEITHAQLQGKVNRAMDAYKKNPNSRNIDAVTAADNELSTFKDESQKKIQKYKQDEMSKIQKKIMVTANIVGRENGFELIFPIDRLLYVGTDVQDVTELIKKKINH